MERWETHDRGGLRYARTATAGQALPSPVQANELRTSRPHPYRSMPGDVSHFKIVDHAYFDAEDNETYGLVALYDHDQRIAFWMNLRQYLSIDSKPTKPTKHSNPVAWMKLSEYLDRQHRKGAVNYYYPVFTIVTTSHERSSVRHPQVYVALYPQTIQERLTRGMELRLVYHPDAILLDIWRGAIA